MSTENTTNVTEAEDKATGMDVAATNAGTEDVAGTAIAQASSGEVATTDKPATAYITQLLQNTFEDFKKANDGLDLDFVYMGSWLVVDKKGDFVDKDDDTLKYKDHIDVVIGQGEKRWSLWGLQNSPEDGTLIVACKEKEDAIKQLTDWLAENPEASERYSVDDLELRYMASVVPVDAIAESDGIPKIYIMSFAPTATIAYGKYAMNVFRGAYKKLGIPARTGLTSVVTRLSTEEQKSRKDASVSWLAITFEAMGLFNPEDYKAK
ncbi:MAG: hypothetical protein PHR92_16390 [Lachnospiraceae bacterium]|nr:hypothetical protein [Lachnospiraceae bacterium]